jgi:hypothetical protein
LNEVMMAADTSNQAIDGSDRTSYRI